MPLQTSTSRAYKLPYHHLQEVGLDYRESYGGISVIPPRTRTTSAVTRKTPSSNIRIRAGPYFTNKSRNGMATTEKQVESDPRIPTAASSWNQRVLNYLHAQYKKNECTEFTFDGLMMSSELKNEIETISSELAGVNDGNELTPVYKFDSDDRPKLIRFESSFHDLSQILARDEERRTPVSTSTNTPMFTTPDQQFTLPDAAVCRTPEQNQQVLLDHMSIGEDSPHSTESNRSAKPEHHTASFANNFLRATYFSLAKHLGQKAWFEDPSRLGVVTEQTMSITVGKSNVTAKSDGGISFYPEKSASPIYPIFCIEAKRKKSRYRDSETANYMHAAQIYAELLGQVCHRKQYRGNLQGHQEAFLLHARHATFYIFHATFPNSYLRDIVEHGADYEPEIRPGFSHPKITIEHSRPFRMRKPTHQAQFFKLLAEVLCYVVAGDNDIGFVSKSEWNPYWKIHTGFNKRPMYECIRVKIRSYPGSDSMINEEGDLDNESEDSDFEHEMMNNRNVQLENRLSGSSIGSRLSTVARHGSPMSYD